MEVTGKRLDFKELILPLIWEELVRGFGFDGCFSWCYFCHKFWATKKLLLGLLGLIQATYLTTTPELIPFARSALALARNPDQEFPLLVLSINVSRIALHALRDGLLNRLVVEEESAWTTVNTFYAAVLHHVVERWRREQLTITSSGCVLQEAEKTARSSPASLVRGFERSLASDFTVQSKQAAREQVERDSKEPWLRFLLTQAYSPFLVVLVRQGLRILLAEILSDFLRPYLVLTLW